MATIGERVAALEVRMDNLRDDLTDIQHDIGDKSLPDSIRGRLHAVEGNQQALGIVTQHRATILRGWNAVILTFCALVTAAASIVAAVWVIVAG